MSAKKAFYAMLIGITLLIALCAAGTYFGQKMIVKEGDKLENAKLEAGVAEERKALLEQAIRDINEYEDLETIAKTVVPQEKDQARTVLEIVQLARRAGINIVSVQFPSSELGQVTARRSGPATARGGATNNQSLTQLTPVEGLSGVYEMNIDIQADQQIPVSYDQLILYLTLLENNRRTAQVSNISITPSVENPNFVSFSLSLKSFVKP